MDVGVPSARFAIDYEHPMATPAAYRELGQQALRPAQTYIKRELKKQIYVVRWSRVASFLPGENKRFDLVLGADSCQSYLANGVVVQSRTSRKVSGYNHI